jgi:pimeloyl-ACP methyl ester carboxylesterase
MNGSDQPLRVEEDSFFIPPEGFERLPAGTVLRTREVDLALFGRVRQRFSAWQLLYRTCDLNQRPQAGVTTVVLPQDAPADGARPLVSYQCMIDSMSSQCFPSYALRVGTGVLPAVPQVELPLIAGMLEQGWAVSIPDHEGLRGHMGVAREPGYYVLDGVRAALSFQPLGLHADTPVGLWGYSGGGMATSWAAEMAPEHAPELAIVGIALGSPVGDPAGVFLDLNRSHFAGLPLIVVAALCDAYPEVDRVIRENLTATGLAVLEAVPSMTTDAALRAMRNQDFAQFATRPIPEILALPQIRAVLAEIRLGERVPNAPLLVVQSVSDQIIFANRVDGQVRRYRAAGAHVTYLRDRLSEHMSLLVLAAPTTIDWLADRFAGRPLPANETRTVWSVAASPVFLRGIVGGLQTLARMATGLPIRARGPQLAARRQTMAEEAA